MNADNRGSMCRKGAGRESGTADIYWIPLGAGAHIVRFSGRLFEAISSRVHRRPACDLYHSALVVVVPEGHFVIEMTPIPDVHGGRRGVVMEGAVGTTLAGRLRTFRYEIRRWRDGIIPDASAAVASPIRVTQGSTDRWRRCGASSGELHHVPDRVALAFDLLEPDAIGDGFRCPVLHMMLQVTCEMPNRARGLPEQELNSTGCDPFSPVTRDRHVRDLGIGAAHVVEFNASKYFTRRGMRHDKREAFTSLVTPVELTDHPPDPTEVLVGWRERWKLEEALGLGIMIPSPNGPGVSVMERTKGEIFFRDRRLRSPIGVQRSQAGAHARHDGIASASGGRLVAGPGGALPLGAGGRTLEGEGCEGG